MAIFVPEYNGYIADVPTMLFERCDGARYYFDELDSCSVTQNAEVLTINGGQSNFPLAQIDTSKTFEIQAASAQFKLEMFEMANATTHTEGDVGILDGGLYEVGTGLKITIPYEVQANSVKITGAEEAQSVAAGKFTVSITAAGSDADGKTEITFNTGDVAVGDSVFVTYKRRVNGGKIVSIDSNSTTARGSVTLIWPIYSAGTDCSEASEKARLILEVMRVRVTALPGFSSSYKQAGTNEITMAALDPKRADKRVARYIYEEITAESGHATGDVDWD